MRELRYTLLTDGSSDTALLPILSWALKWHVDCPVQETWADLRYLSRPPKRLADRIQVSLDLYPCDLLFIHRDAEREPLPKRIAEIRQGLEEAGQWKVTPAVCVIPVRMTEAWLLIDERAVRRAAGNPHGQEALDLPSVGTLEHVSYPKSLLYDCLRKASGLSGNRRKRFRVTESVQRISSFIQDFSPLRSLSAFVCLENSIKRVVSEQSWTPNLPDATDQE